MKWVVLIGAVLAGLGGSEARAATQTYESIIRESQLIALGYWRAVSIEPCSPVRLKVDQTLYDHYADSWADGCEIRLDTRMRQIHPVSICTVIVHEYGHLGRLEHSDDPYSVMHMPPPVSFAPCLPTCGSAAHRRWMKKAQRLRGLRREAKRRRAVAKAQSIRPRPYCRIAYQ